MFAMYILTREHTSFTLQNFPGAELLCMFPSASFIQDLPLDVAVIFTFDSNHWGIMHNFRKVNPSPLLDEIAAYT